jgi:NADH-quinone oxidoreductase subunit A
MLALFGLIEKPFFSLAVMLTVNSEINPDGLLTFFIYAGVALGLAGTILLLSFLLGQHHNNKLTGEVYESGVPAVGKARLRFSSQFYLVAMLFVIFDLEAVFIIAWAIAFESVGIAGFIGASIFIGVLALVLVYEWKVGALDFGPNNKGIIRAYQRMDRNTLPDER